MDWHEAQFYESSSNVRDAIRSVTGREPSSTVARHISVCMQQGRSYMTTALTSPLDIRPLLIYYGVLSFAKAIVMSRRLTSIGTLVPSHGLKDTSAGDSRMSNLQCLTLARGTFQDFSNSVTAVGRAHYYDSDYSDQYVRLPFDSVDGLEGHKLNLKDVLSRVFQVSDLFARTYGERSNCMTVSLDYNGPDGAAELRLDDPEVFSDRESLTKIVQRLREDYPFLQKLQLNAAEKAWNNSVLKFLTVTDVPENEFSEAILSGNGNGFIADTSRNALVGPDLASLLQPLGRGLTTETPVAMKPIGGKFLSDYSLAFLGSFMLGSLVRYRPQTWIHALSRSALSDAPADDRELALIEKFLTTVTDDIPQLAIQSMRGAF